MIALSGNDNMLGNLFIAIIGGIVGAILTSRVEIWKGWKLYNIVRLEIDRNLGLLKNLQRSIMPSYESNGECQLKQIDQMTDALEDKLPIRVLLLVQQTQKTQSWSHTAWESQLHLLSYVLSEAQIKKIFELQVSLERLSTLMSNLSTLVHQDGDSARILTIGLFDDWQTIATQTLENGNPLLAVPIRTQILTTLGLQRFVRCSSSEME